MRIVLYYDELGIVNPLGSKTGLHKIGTFYFVVQNLPPHMNSELSSIHVLILCCDTDVKKYDINKILEPFLKDLEKLESDEGVPMLILDIEEVYVLRASIAAFCGDGLAVHKVYNFLEPAANLFCRMCLYSRENLHDGSLACRQARTIDTYNTHIEFLKNAKYSDQVKPLTGIHGECTLNYSRYFHICHNKVFDPMHDILCGIGPMVLKLVVCKFVLELKFFNTQNFNSRISAFHYAFVKRKNKPSANFNDRLLNSKGHTLNQKAMQM